MTVRHTALALLALCATACGATIGAPASDPTVKDQADVAPSALGDAVEFGPGEAFELAPVATLPPFELPATTMIEVDLALMKKLRAASDSELVKAARGAKLTRAGAGDGVVTGARLRGGTRRRDG